MLNQVNKVAAVSALTTIAAQQVDANATAGIETAIKNANSKVTHGFGLTGVDLTADIPADLSHAQASLTQNQINYGAVQAALSQTLKDQNLSALQLLSLVKDISKDFADGVVDGKAGSTALESSTTITPAQALTGLNTAMENFMNSSNNKSGYSSQSVDVTVPAPEHH